MKKPITTILSFLLFGLLVNAQLEVGIKAGLNYSKWILSENTENEIKSKIGFNGGFTVLFGLSMGTGFELETGLFLSQKGFVEKDDFSDLQESTTVNAFYVDLPLKLNYVFEGMNGSFFIGAGPVLSYGIGGKITYKSIEEEISTDILWGSEPGYFNPVDLGLGMHAGIRLTKLQISAFYDKGLKNIFNDSDRTAKNQVLGVSLGYIF